MTVFWWLSRSTPGLDIVLSLTILFLPLHVFLLVLILFVRWAYAVSADIVRLYSPKPLGMEHVRWDCKCGKRIYDKYTELDIGGISRLQTVLDDLLFERFMSELDRSFLGRLYQKILQLQLSEQDYGRQAGAKGSQSPAGFWDLRANAATLKLLCQRRNNSGLPRHRGDIHSGDAEGDVQGTKPRGNVEPQYLLLCVPVQGHANQLLQIDTTIPPTSDDAFFRLLRETYTTHRGRLRRLLSLQSLAEIRFAHFELFRHNLADVREYDRIPPETHRDQYIYRPMPAEFEPPIGKNQMKHLYDHPDHAGELAVCFARVPRKLHERLFYKSVADRNEGWGVCFFEGVSWSRVCLFGLVGVTACTVFGVTWTVLKDDVQGGFGVASYMLAVLVLALGALQGAFEI